MQSETRKLGVSRKTPRTVVIAELIAKLEPPKRLVAPCRQNTCKQEANTEPNTQQSVLTLQFRRLLSPEFHLETLVRLWLLLGCQRLRPRPSLNAVCVLRRDPYSDKRIVDVNNKMSKCVLIQSFPASLYQLSERHNSSKAFAKVQIAHLPPNEV